MSWKKRWVAAVIPCAGVVSTEIPRYIFCNFQDLRYIFYFCTLFWNSQMICSKFQLFPLLFGFSPNDSISAFLRVAQPWALSINFGLCLLFLHFRYIFRNVLNHWHSFQCYFQLLGRICRENYWKIQARLPGGNRDFAETWSASQHFVASRHLWRFATRLFGDRTDERWRTTW